MNSSKPKHIKPLLTVLIPAYNEEKTISKIVTDTLKIKNYRIDIQVAIDSKTNDNTEKVAKQAGANVIKTKKTLGKGDVVKYAIPYLHGDYIIQIDADYQFLPSDIPKLIKPLEKGWDVTLGTRYQKGAYVEKGSVSPLKLFGSYFLSFSTSLAIGQSVTDVMAGFKAFKKDVLRSLHPQTSHFGYEAELVIKAAQKKYKIKNVPISYKKRNSGQSSVNSIKHGILVLDTIIRTRLSLD